MEHSDVFDEVDRNASDLNNHPTVMAHRLSPKKALSSNPSREWVKKIVCEAGADDAGAVEAISLGCPKRTLPVTRVLVTDIEFLHSHVVFTAI